MKQHTGKYMSKMTYVLVHHKNQHMISYSALVKFQTNKNILKAKKLAAPKHPLGQINTNSEVQ